MDEGKIPKEATRIVAIIVVLVIIQSFLFVNLVERGIFVLFGMLIFMVFFSVIDNITEKKEIDNVLKYNSDWFKSQHKLPKEIP